jgi:hypothetical protein
MHAGVRNWSTGMHTQTLICKRCWTKTPRKSKTKPKKKGRGKKSRPAPVVVETQLCPFRLRFVRSAATGGETAASGGRIYASRVGHRCGFVIDDGGKCMLFLSIFGVTKHSL